MNNRKFHSNERRSFTKTSAAHQGNRRNRFNQSRKRRFAGKSIDITKFVNKITAPIAEEKFQSKILFADFPLDQRLKINISKQGFKSPTEIQEKTIPLILKGQDLIGLANTGTGKTGAFLIPMIEKILQNPREKLLIIAPTRELALQIQEEFRKFCANLKINSVVLVGGANIRPQINLLHSPHNVIIGTPGRLKDLVNRKKLFLQNVTNVVLDEADQMLDMGFVPDIRFLLSLTKSEKQTLLFSATLAPEIEKLSNEFLKNPVKVSIKTRDTSECVDQDVIRIQRHEDKIEVLGNLLSENSFQKVLVFSRTKHGAEKLSKALFHKGFKSESIHGNKSQAKRQKALQLFKEDFIQILVATDVAARGLDIPNVSHVINFDVPATFEDYVHRIGRTGRAGKIGSALTFIESR